MSARWFVWPVVGEPMLWARVDALGAQWTEGDELPEACFDAADEAVDDLISAVSEGREPRLWRPSAARADFGSVFDWLRSGASRPELH